MVDSIYPTFSWLLVVFNFLSWYFKGQLFSPWKIVIVVFVAEITVGFISLMISRRILKWA